MVDSGMGNIDKIIIHCSDSDNPNVTVSTVHKWHLERGFDGIGYHYFILQNGILEIGRPEYWKGAHCKGQNDNSIGICLHGSYTFTYEQFVCLRRLCNQIIKRHHIKTIKGHGDYDKLKTCPDFNVSEFLRFNGLSKYL